MGIVGGILSAIGAVVSFATQRSAAKKAEKAAKKREAITSARDRTRELAARRRAMRERRIKIARIQQSAASAGVSGSSGEIGATSSISTNYAGVVADAGAETRANIGINQANTAIAQAQVDAQQGAALGSLFSAAGQFVASDPFSGFGGTSTGYTGGTTKKAPSGQVRGFSPWGTFGGGV